MFKSNSDTGTMANKVESTEREIATTSKLVDLLTCYIGSVVLKTFKSEKLNLYKRMLQQFTVVEISNSHQLAGFWSNVLQHPKVKAAC